jgi:Tol biopolymer transport system component
VNVVSTGDIVRNGSRVSSLAFDLCSMLFAQLPAVYTSDRAEPGNLDLWVHPLAQGAQPRRLTNHPGREISPSISPDGAQVAFCSRREGGGIYIIPTFGGYERLVVRGGVNPRFSPDGKWIV